MRFYSKSRDCRAVFLITGAKSSPMRHSMLGVTVVLYAIASEIHMKSWRFPRNCSKVDAISTALAPIDQLEQKR